MEVADFGNAIGLENQNISEFQRLLDDRKLGLQLRPQRQTSGADNSGTTCRCIQADKRGDEGAGILTTGLLISHLRLDALLTDRRRLDRGPLFELLQRRDPSWLLLARTIESLLFFQPLNRKARKLLQDRLRETMEEWRAQHLRYLEEREESGSPEPPEQ